MQAWTRRQLLGAACLATTITAGCLGDDAAPEVARLSTVSVRNMVADRRHEVEVTVEEAGEPVYEETGDLEPGTQMGDTRTATEPGRYVVRVVVEAVEETVDVVDLTEDEEDCINLWFDIYEGPEIVTVPQPTQDDC